MSKNVFSGKFDPADEGRLRENLEKDNFILSGVQHAFWQAQRERLFITFYRSGKVLIQGKNATDYAEQYLLPLKTKQNIHGLEYIKSLKNWIGTDESGKGDFFGPLVVGALYVNKKQEKSHWGISYSGLFFATNIIEIGLHLALHQFSFFFEVTNIRGKEKQWIQSQKKM